MLLFVQAILEYVQVMSTAGLSALPILRTAGVSFVSEVTPNS